MKKLLLILCAVFLVYNANAKDTLEYNNIISRHLELEFNQVAKDFNSYIEWILIGDWDDFKVSFNQGNHRGNKFIIKAKNYKTFVDGNHGIFLTLKPRKRAAEGYKTIRMEVTGYSPSLEMDTTTLNLQIPSFYYIAPPAVPWWLRLIYAFVCVLVLFHLFWFVVLKRRLYPKMTGTLQFSDGSVVRLNKTYAYVLYTGAKKPDISKESILSKIYCGKKGTYQIPYPETERNDQKYILIKAEKRGKGYINRLAKINGIEFMSHTMKLYHQQEYIFKDANDDMTVSFLYDNEKHQI